MGLSFAEEGDVTVDMVPVTSVRIALWIRIITSSQVAKLSWLMLCTFQLILMELRSEATLLSRRTFW